MLLRSLIAIAAIPLFALGCSSGTDSNTQAGDDAANATDTASDDASGDDAAAPDTNAAQKPATPAMSGVMPMGGSLHVSWKLNDTGLSNVQVWRKANTGAYALAYTLSGSSTYTMDSQATDTSTTYCYEVKTVKAGVESDFSNEKCGKP